MNMTFNPESEGWKKRNVEGFFSMLGPLWSRKLEESWEYGLLVESQHHNPLGIAHGGMLVTFIDQAISTIAWSAAGRQPCATVQLDTHFLAPAKAGDFIVARVEVTRKSSSLIFLRGQLHVEDREILSAQALMKIVQRSSE